MFAALMPEHSCKEFAYPYKPLSTCLSKTFLTLFYCRLSVPNKLVEQRLMCASIHPFIHPIPINPHLHYVPETSFQHGSVPPTLLIGRHRETNTCHFVINTCCVITDTCFCLHWLFHGDRIGCNEWLNAFLHFNNLHWSSFLITFLLRLRRASLAYGQLGLLLERWRSATNYHSLFVVSFSQKPCILLNLLLLFFLSFFPIMGFLIISSFLKCSVSQ